MSNPFYNYDTAFIPGQLARAEAVANEFISVQTGFSLLVTQGVDSGIAANAYVVDTLGQPTVVYADGNIVEFKPNFTNTGVSTVNVNAIGAVPVLRFNGSALIPGDITAGVWTTAVYNVAFNAFTLIGAGQTAVIPGSISLAAPTNKVGLVASGGVSTQAVPIDATYAIDQSIAPTWSGVHTFSVKPVMNAGLTVTGAAITSSAGLTVSAGATAVQALTVALGLVVTPNGSADAAQFNVNHASGNGVLFNDTNASPQNFRIGLGIGDATASLVFYDSTNTAIRLKITSNGSVVVGAPTGAGQGTGTINATGLFVNGVSVIAGSAVTSIAGTANQIAASASTGAVTLSLSQNVIIPAPASGTGLTVNGLANADTAVFKGSASSGQSFGLDVQAGTNASDISFRVLNQAASLAYFQVIGDGGVIIGAPTGGTQGIGTLNASGLFVSGVNQFRTGNFIATLTGMSAATTGTMFWTISGNLCTLYIGSSAISGTSNAATMTMTGLPVTIQPARNTAAVVVVVDAGNDLFGYASLPGATGTISFFLAQTNVVTNRVEPVIAGFTSTGTKGLDVGWSMTYSLV